MTFFGPSMTEKNHGRNEGEENFGELPVTVGGQGPSDACFSRTRMCKREMCIARPPTTHCNRELPEIFLALASTTVFSVMDGPKNVMQLRLRPAQDEKPIFCHDFLS